VGPIESKNPKLIDSKKMAGKKVLIVEDNADLSDLFQICFQKAKAEVTLAFNGQEAVDAVQDKKYDIIFMDAEMPVMDGLSATEILRENGVKIPIVMLSAHTQKDKRSAWMQAGVTAILSKPILGTDLVEFAGRTLS
jgi:CheY-like chemotaxis protein